MRSIGRRRFLVASGLSPLVAGASASALAGCSELTRDEPSTPRGDGELTADDALLAAGSQGLIDETIFQERAGAYLEHATAELDPTNVTNVVAHLIRQRRDPEFDWSPHKVTVESLGPVWAMFDELADTRDFSLMYLLWLVELGDGIIADEVVDEVRRVVVENRWRYDDPRRDGVVDNQWFWSENHRIIWAVCEHLAGSRWPDETFELTGLSGADHAERSRPLIVEWLAERARFGFFEWHSNVYMLKNITPLITLVELSDDPELVTVGAIGLDMCLMDLALHLQRGTYTAPRGRTYKKDKMRGTDEATFGTAKLLFDDTEAPYGSRSDNGATYLAGAARYRVPQLVVEVATSTGVDVIRERHGLFVDGSAPIVDSPPAPAGYDFTSPSDLPFWWSTGGLGLWQIAEVSVAEANRNDLWSGELFAPLLALRDLNGGDPARIAAFEQQNAAFINFGFLGEANTYMWRSPDVALASVIGHRPGERRDQVHSWQATIDDAALVFTNHPATPPAASDDWAEDGDPGYWTGEASLPHSAQFERCAAYIYQPAYDVRTNPLLGGLFGYEPYTHAYFPQEFFDEVRQSGQWTIGAKGGGYIALWSWRAPRFRPLDDGVYAVRDYSEPFDLVAPGGPDNVWLVEVGNSSDGSFPDFVKGVLRSRPEVSRRADGLGVQWVSPSAGTVTFGVRQPLTVAGERVDQSDFPRHESRWGTIERGAEVYSWTAGASTLRLDTADLRREIS